MIQKYPKFAERLREGLQDIFGDKAKCVVFMNIILFIILNQLRRRITTHHAEDGSGVGSAIIAGSCLDRSWH